MSSYIDDLKEGEWICYFKNGQIQTKVTFKNNEKHGAQLFYNKNGSIDEEIFFINGVKVSKPSDDPKRNTSF